MKTSLPLFLKLKTAQDGDAILAKANKNRSILWANHYGTIQVDDLQAYSNAIGDWAGMSSELGLSSPNTEIVMEWGMNALLYATNGGQIVVGNLQGKTSQFYANGDGANGVIAGAAGSKSGSEKGRPSTSSVTVKNAHFQLEGWNNHVADTVYGGYANLEKVTSTTGKLGSYAVGQASALANDFGNGVVDAVDFHTTVYGNRSAGGYVIGGGVITAKNSSFVSKMDAGLVIASGGTYKVQNSTVEGQIAIRNRGGVVADSASTFDNVQLTVNRDLNHYVTGAQAQQAESVNEENHWQAKLEKISAYSGTGIPFLAWTKEEIEVETSSSINYARIQGKFSEKVTQATLNGKPIIVQDDGTIDLYFGFPRESSTSRATIFSILHMFFFIYKLIFTNCVSKFDVQKYKKNLDY